MAHSADEVIAELADRGFEMIDDAPKDPAIRAGARVRNYSERFPSAYQRGTATVVAVMRRGSDARPDSWEMSWGRPNVEVVVERDAGEENAHRRAASWADYRTASVEDPIGGW